MGRMNELRNKVRQKTWWGGGGGMGGGGVQVGLSLHALT